jgi:hypothetical protein
MPYNLFVILTFEQHSNYWIAVHIFASWYSRYFQNAKKEVLLSLINNILLFLFLPIMFL